jgi:quinol monooxygenase YgiN
MTTPFLQTGGDKTMTALTKTTALLKARPGRSAELESLLRGLAADSRAEPGNLRWDLWQGFEDVAMFVVDELYKDAASVQFHRGTPHYQNYLAKINDLAMRTAVTARPLDVV